MNDIIVVGGSSGIGLCICERLIADGKNVICISKSLCPAAGAVSKVADVTDRTAMKKIFSSIDRADGLIYCAGASLASPAEYVEESDVKYVTDVNLTCAMECVRLALPILKNGKSRIALLSSMGGVSPIAFDSFYSAAKAGLIKYSEALYLELPENISCTAFVIGGTKTRFTFKRKVYSCGDARYEKNLTSAVSALKQIEQSGARADCVAKKILKTFLSDKKPSPVVAVGLKNKAAALACKLMPRRLMLWVTKKVYRVN